MFLWRRPGLVARQPVRTSRCSFIRVMRQSPRSHASTDFGSLLVHTGYAAVAKVPCKHGLWLVARSYGLRGSRQGLVQARTLARCPRKKEQFFAGGERTALLVFMYNSVHVFCSRSFVLLPERFGTSAPYTFGIQFNGILQSALHVRSHTMCTAFFRSSVSGLTIAFSRSCKCRKERPINRRIPNTSTGLYLNNE